ncbi:uncharacterized protein L201_007030 [Kwoniella dendrophila CBS 6074]|uniref:Uncharacterized protein n=1 Tax=Kwoniella dendrophila CBS 6074 TaxID=1295534 RepID=A0AAX4K3A9_9TREE
MSSSPFPQLLKRANIATYDPLITRIYTSTPSSKSQHSDWGLKFAVPVKKGPRYIKFNSLDAGPGVNCDWRSGEREARFIQAWGNGTVRWTNEDDVPAYIIKRAPPPSATGFSADALVEEIYPDQEGNDSSSSSASSSSSILDDKIYMKDIEIMTEKEFENYLNLIRSNRKSFLKERLNNLPNSISNSLILPEDKTLIHLESTGKTTQNSFNEFQSNLTKLELKDLSKNKLHSNSHKTNGLSYSKQPTSTIEHFVSDKKGRVLNKVSRYDDFSSSNNRSNRIGGGNNNNLPWVIGLGGLTGKTNNQNNRTTDFNNNHNSIEQTDYTRTKNINDGVGKFKINKAEMSSTSSPPIVLALNESKYTSHKLTGGRFRQSLANQPSPLDTFKFDIDLSISSIENDSNSEPLQPGSREWVASETKISNYNNLLQNGLGGNLGGPRIQRQQGEALERLQRKQNTQDTVQRLQKILTRHRDQNKDKNGTGSS